MSLKNFLTTPRFVGQFSPSDVKARVQQAESIGLTESAKNEFDTAILQSRFVKSALGFCAAVAFVSAITTDKLGAQLACTSMAALFTVMAKDARRNQKENTKALKAFCAPPMNTPFKI